MKIVIHLFSGELFGRLAVALVFTPLIGFNAICYAGPVAWLLADIPLVIIYLNKKKNFKKLLTDKENYGKLFWLSKNDRNS